MSSDIVENWFGSSFKELSPELQKLHRQGGKLSGRVNIQFGSGLAGMLGKRIARKLGIPLEDSSNLSVEIFHDKNELHWNRTFNSAQKMESVFKPVGTHKEGYWLEKTGALHLKLTVEIKDGGWYWKCLGYKVFGVPLPVWLFPGSKAYKLVEDRNYRFYVGFFAPFIGKLLSYEGTLKMEKVSTR